MASIKCVYIWLHHSLPQELREEINKTQKVIFEVTGTTPVLFRPPGGFVNKRVIDVTKEFNYSTVLWSWWQDTQDWRMPGVRRIVNKVLKNARNGDIVLFHDSGRHTNQTVAAIKQLLPELKKRGYQFVTVSELVEIGKYHKTKVDKKIRVH